VVSGSFTINFSSFYVFILSPAAEVMKLLPPSDTSYLAQKLLEIHQNTQLTPSESIPKLRSVLDLMYKALTAEASYAFSSLYARMMFIQNHFPPPESLSKELNQLRSFCNKVVHEIDFVPAYPDYVACNRIMLNALSYFSGKAIQELIPFELNLQDTVQELDVTFHYNRERVSIMDIIVLHVSELRTSSEQNLQYCIITGHWGNQAEKVSVIFRDFEGEHYGARLSNIQSQVWKYARLYIYNLVKDAEKHDCYLSTPSTTYVLEPDFLIQATDIARCCEDHRFSPELALLGWLVDGGVSKSLLVGAMVNRLFDELLYEPNGDFESLFDALFLEYALDIQAIVANKGLEFEVFLAELKADLQAHIANLSPTIAKFLKRENCNLVIEPSFYAPFFGLFGRLDLLIVNKEQRELKEVIELKTGAPPNPQFSRRVKSDHEAQTQVYALLLEATYRRMPTISAILYSKARPEELPIREVYCGTNDRQNVSMVRNFIVAQLHQLAQGNPQPIQTLATISPTELPRFRQNDIIYFQSIWRKVNEFEQAYFLNYVGFILREYRNAKVGNGKDENDYGFASLWRSSEQDKRESFSLLNYLEMDYQKSDFTLMHITLNRTNLFSTGKTTSFRNGDIVVLYPMEVDGRTKPLQHQLLKCYIKSISATEVVLSFRNKLSDMSWFKDYPYWVIEPDFMEKGFHIQLQSLFQFIGHSNERKKRVILGLEAPLYDNTEWNLEDYSLNPEQAQNIRQALNAQDYFIMQGPPGTGKTSVVLKTIVDVLHQNTQENILLLAFTNRAVDEMADKVAELGLDYHRLGFGNDERESTWRAIVRQKRFDGPAVVEYFQRVRIFVSTVSSFLSSQKKLAFKHFHTAIVDEASQLLDPHLAGILISVDRFVLIGDEKQLPAISTQKEQEVIPSSELLIRHGFQRLSNSIFDRLLYQCKRNGWTDAFGMLAAQGRMHQAVAEFVNRQFYDNQLRTFKPHQTAENTLWDNQSSNPMEQLLAQHRFCFINTQIEQQTKVNYQEAKWVCIIAEMLALRLGENFNSDSIGIITPYRAQITAIQERLPESIRGLITVDTVERYQGSERDYIIFSICTSSEYQLNQLQCLDLEGRVDKKLNVALTRAKAQVVILGNEEILESATYYQALIDYCKAQKAYMDARSLEQFFRISSAAQNGLLF
jgi:DNA replication ATP-dependent helicase Dna2